MLYLHRFTLYIALVILISNNVLRKYLPRKHNYFNVNIHDKKIVTFTVANIIGFD